MGHSQAEKQASRDRILQAAAALVRERGIDGVGLAELMAEAGLTHGGFYRHFASRDDLIAEALARALAEGEVRLAAASDAAAAPLSALARAYLSTAHRDDVASGCAVAALAPDVARAAPDVRRLFTRQIVRNADLIRRCASTERGAPADRADALNALSLMAGALMLARAVDDPALSDDILAAARSSLSPRKGRAKTRRPPSPATRPEIPR